MTRKIINYGTLALIIAVLIIGGYFYWLHQKIYPNTDDAYIQAHVINVAAQINGKVEHIYVKNQQAVTKHQLLFTIDQKPFKIALEKAQANLQNAKQGIIAKENAVAVAQSALAQRQAEFSEIQKNNTRIIPLVKKGYYAQAAGDKINRQLVVAKQAVSEAKDNLAEAIANRGKTGNQNAQIQLAQAAVNQAKLNLQYTKVFASSNGQLAQFTLQPGQTITAYQPLFSLVDTQDWWATANMKETNLNRIRVGQHAIIHVDMYPSHPFQGMVTSIGAGSGESFALLPAENASGNWVKVTQRFPVRIKILNTNANFPLRMGASCTATINTK